MTYMFYYKTGDIRVIENVVDFKTTRTRFRALYREGSNTFMFDIEKKYVARVLLRVYSDGKEYAGWML